MKKEMMITPANAPELEEKYEAPAIEIVEVIVEQGFQASLEREPNDPYSY